ncbi:hypothetical protein PHLCEN_2v9177 [Hermanssonia centrifuga]|uniref:Uncharacterized protein n=1 Tax=Hermanssonia centrifuga TaxID=98765 RepID=A0A2R6NRJ7_9APHY|nr:hypothetical protein PHLCEN_2v9177 [Hermanssonia centrifuga]
MLVVWCMLRRRRKEIDDDFEEGYPPFPIKLRKPHEKVAGIDDPPIPFDPYGYGAVSASSPSEGVSGSFAGRPRAASVRRRNPTSSEGYPHSMPPIPLIPLSDDIYRRTTPPAVPTSVGSIPSGSGSSERLAVHRPLQVMNPTPTSAPPARDTKDPMIYLSANRGLEVRAGSSDPLQNASPSGPLASGSHTADGDNTLHGSSYVPFVHRDGGSLPIPNPPPRSRVVEGADTPRVPTDAPPPAYQE